MLAWRGIAISRYRSILRFGIEMACREGISNPSSTRLAVTQAPVTLYRIACVSDYFSYRIGVSFTLPRSHPVQHVGAKSLRSGGDTKSNPICVKSNP